MYGYKKYAMLNYTQISFLEYPELVNSARYGVKISPESFSANKVIVVERSFDDLGEYSFVGLSIGGIKLCLLYTSPSPRD